ncbi:hypothetical protein IMX26_12625 [Clostridium sp. 'deep sea']|uniref:hypothetical protein n=1 Tax=Clostridium sp. 'deep sea' TaxID=2779445 RepID=UPI00189696EE|nr:hypothetical protein [Clostridium sp. 'deep sea']QOR34328.1 hypothetical protein IMX26_12625 [Clostridium sp. 'deep sea']
MLQNNQATLLAILDSSIPDIKDFDRPVEVFVLIEKFINYYNSENYEKIKSLWLTKEINDEFDVSPAKDNVILTFNHRYGPRTVHLPKDCFKEIKFNSFVLYKTGFSSIGLYTDYNNERKYLLFDITKNKEDKYCINGIEVKDDTKQ